MSIIGSDPVQSVLTGALDGLSYRQRVTADNVANMDTPGFIAAKVDFEDNLRAAIVSGDVTASSATPSVTASTNQVGADGNNVDLATEQMQSVQDTFRYQLLTRAVGDRYGMITTAIGGM
jgi:flagellar basal-body rod protein FlgB